MNPTCGQHEAGRRVARSESCVPPVVVLVRPQLGENVGAAARAMLNCGLERLRLVRPSPRMERAKAVAMAAGARRVMEGAATFDSLEEAVADVHCVFALSARRRAMHKKILSPRLAAQALARMGRRGVKSALVFGPEQSGLDNAHVGLADAMVRADLNPVFPSLNLGQAVLLLGYEWYLAALSSSPPPAGEARPRPAARSQLHALFRHMEKALEACRFVGPDKRSALTLLRLRNMALRATLMEEEVRLLRGALAALFPPVDAMDAAHVPRAARVVDTKGGGCVDKPL